MTIDQHCPRCGQLIDAVIIETFGMEEGHRCMLPRLSRASVPLAPRRAGVNKDGVNRRFNEDYGLTFMRSDPVISERWRSSQEPAQK